MPMEVTKMEMRVSSDPNSPSWSTFLLTEGDDQLDLQPLVPEQVKKHRVEEGEAGSGLGGLGRS